MLVSVAIYSLHWKNPLKIGVNSILESGREENYRAKEAACYLGRGKGARNREQGTGNREQGTGNREKIKANSDL
jgi:hypothetical protein